MENFSSVFGNDFAAAFIVLMLFGVLYNILIEYFQRRTTTYTAELVAIGVLVTLIAGGFIIGWINALKLFALFAASGSPMIIGSWIRNAKDVEHSRQIIKERLDGIKN